MNHHGNKTGALPRLARVAFAVVLAGVCLAPLAQAQRRTEQADKRFSDGTELVQLDFRDVELAVVIEAIAKITGFGAIDAIIAEVTAPFADTPRNTSASFIASSSVRRSVFTA